MEHNPTYKVQFTGQFKAGIEPTDAITAFAALAKIPDEQATAVLSQPRILKKQLDINIAHAYRDKLHAIGLEVNLQPETQQKQIMELSLEPIEDRHAPSPVGKTAQPASKNTSSVDITCPKCGHQQKPTAQCESCGVYIHKVLPKAAEEPQQTTPSPTKQSHNVTESISDWDEPQDPKLIAIAATTAVAILCAFVWKWIAVATEYEVGLVAWGIGGAIGFAAIALGSIGIRTAVICGVLALGSIVGGKYLTQDYFLGDYSNEMQALFSNEEVAELYQDYAETAQYFVNNVHTDDEIRQFMVEYEYTEATSPENISSQELSDFKEIEAPELRSIVEMATTNGDVDNVDGQTLLNGLSQYSTWDAVKDSLAPIDFLFFFLGIATAFRMGLTGRLK